MTIYNNFEFGKAYTLSDLQNHYNIPTSIHDNVIINYTSALGMGNDALSAQSMTYMDFQGYQLIHAATPIIDQRDEVWSKELKDNIINPNKDLVHKDYQYGIIPCERIDPNIPNKKQENLHNRSLLLLDFDAMGTKTIADIESYLSNYQYFGWTSFNDGMPGKGRRYRLALILSQPIANADVWNYYKPSIVEWMKTGGFVIDSVGSTTFTQLGIGPAINPAIGTITFFRNEGALLDITKDIPLITTPTAPAKAVKASTAKTPKAQATGVATQAEDAPTSPYAAILAANCKLDDAYRDDVLQMALSKSWLTNSTYSSTGMDEHGNNRGEFTLSSIACAAYSCNMNFRHFEKIYDKIVKANKYKGKSAIDCWNNQDDRAGKSAWAFVAMMTPEERFEFKLVLPKAPGTISLEDYTAERIASNKDYDHIITGRYIDGAFIESLNVDFIGINAAPGMGKTHYWKSLSFNGTTQYIMGVPTKIIAAQQADSRICTYDAAGGRLRRMLNDMPDAKTYAVIDETHNVYQIDYREFATGGLIDIIRNRDNLYQVVCQSGTWEPKYIKKLAEINGGTYASVKFVNPNPNNLTYQAVYKEYESNIKVNEMVFSEMAAHNYCPVLIIRQKIAENDKLAEQLNAAGVNAIATDKDTVDTVKSGPAYEFINDAAFEMCNHGLEAIVSTSIAIEGVNIQDNISEALVIVVGGSIDPSYIVQAAGRFRHAKTVHVKHFCAGAERNGNLELYESKRTAEIESRIGQYKSLIASAASLGILTYEAWIRIWKQSGIEYDIEQALLRDGIIWTAGMKEAIVCKQLAELILMCELDRMKFYTSVEHQNAYMREAGFKVYNKGTILETDIDPLVRDAFESIAGACNKVKQSAKQAKKSEITEWLDKSDMEDKYFARNIALKFGIDLASAKLIRMADMDIDEKKSILTKVYTEDWDYEYVRVLVSSDLKPLRTAINAEYPVGKIVFASEVKNILELAIKTQSKICIEQGLDVAEMFERSSSIWFEKLEKIDYMKGEIIDSGRWVMAFIEKYGFINLIEVKKVQKAGKREMTYRVDAVAPKPVAAPIIEDIDFVEWTNEVRMTKDELLALPMQPGYSNTVWVQ